MIKFGVHRLEDFHPEPPSGFFERLAHKLHCGRVSCRLLRVSMPPSQAEISTFEHIMRDLELSSGIYRTTFRRRFEHLDPKTTSILRSRFDASTPLMVEDWAASDCLTSAEWAPALFDAFPKARLAASDLTLFLVEAILPEGDAFILEINSAPIQYLSGPFVIRMTPREPHGLPLNWLLYKRAAAKLEKLRAEWKIPQAWLESKNSELTAGRFQFRKISVTHPEAENLARTDSRFTVRQHSAFDSLAEPVDVIRTMNIFNNAYFSQERLTEGARAVWRSLVPGGVWVVGRTVRQNPPHHEVSYFTRTGSGFELIERVDKGSEIEGLVLAFKT